MGISIENWTTTAIVAVASVAAGKLALALAVLDSHSTALWLPTGIAVTAFLVFGYVVAPAVFLAAFVVSLTASGTWTASLGIALGSTLQGAAAAYLVNRWAQGRHALERPVNVLRFTALAALASTVVSATLGVTSVTLGGTARTADFAANWITWWLGDVTAVLVVSPLLLLWANDQRVLFTRGRVIEGGALLLGVAAISQLVLGAPLDAGLDNEPLAILCVPFLIWAAYRFEAREVAGLLVFIAALAVWGTLRGAGPFVRETPAASVRVLQVFLVTASVSGLALAALVTERRRAERWLVSLAASDGLTGLANYRHLMSALDAELRRSSRTGRSFAVVLFDLDRLKDINDRHGHLVGSRALCRLADALRLSCRVIDTAARFGGDEFALLLPETGRAAARRVARRVVERVARDGELPTISVSAGVATYPVDGDTSARLLEAADVALYEHKRAGAKRAAG